MEPRIVIKTHSKVSNPGIFSILICKCSYPNKSSYPEIVSKRLYELYEKREEGFKLAAKFAVIMAQRFEFLKENMTWDWRGHVIDGVLQYLNKVENENINSFLELTKLEKVIYLKYYLEADGAVILQLAKQIKEHGEISRNKLSKTIHLLFQEIYEGYIELSNDFQKRIELKERLRKIPKEKGYDQDTVQHKLRPHIQPLIDLGILLNPEIKNGDEVYKPTVYNKSSAVEVFLEELKDFKVMEKRFDNNEYFQIVSKVLNLKPVNFNVESHAGLLKESIINGYPLLKENVTQMAHIDALADWCCAKMLAENNVLIEKQSVCNFIENIWRENPQSVRYHVDYRGRKSYVILSESFESNLLRFEPLHTEKGKR